MAVLLDAEKLSITNILQTYTTVCLIETKRKWRKKNNIYFVLSAKWTISGILG